MKLSITQMGFAQNVKSSVTTCTVNQLYAAMDATITNDVCAEISDALEQVKRGEMSREDFETYKREKKKDNLLAGFVPMERPSLENYEKEGKKGSREQAKSVEQGDLFAGLF